MAADDAISAGEATRRVRVESAAESLYRLREELARPGSAGPGSVPSRRARKALRRAHAALGRAGFADAAVATDVLRNVQVLTMATTLATLDYASAAAAHAAIGSLITSSGEASARHQGLTVQARQAQDSGEVPDVTGDSAGPADGVAPPPATDPGKLMAAAVSAGAEGPGAPALDGPAGRDVLLVEAARQIAVEASLKGSRLSQAALAERLRAQGQTIANDRLSWLAATIGLDPQRRG
jgi:hypothetical protein